MTDEERAAKIRDILANPDKYKREWTEAARRTEPHLTEAQLEASWEHVARLFGL